MNALRLASQAAVEELTLEFPNIFGGTRITYKTGFNIGSFPVFFYGIIIAVGIVIAYTYAHFRIQKDFGIEKGRFFDVVFASILAGFVGARVYYCVFQTLDPDGRDYDFITTFTQIHDGGLAIYGGIIAAFAAGFVMCRIRKLKFLAVCDIASLGFLIGQCVGRWGNFVNQEAYGEAVSSDWLFAMTGTKIARKMGAQLVHPCFLYESAWCLLGFILIHFYSKKLRTFDGEILCLYVSWYGLGRFFIEGLRTDSLMAGDVRISQIIAAASCVLGVAALVTFKILAKKKNFVLYVNTEASVKLIADEAEKLRLEKEKRAEKKAKKSAENSSEIAENIEEKSDENSPENPPEIAENYEENSDENSPENPPEITENIEEKSDENSPENLPENSGENEQEKE